jgi:hypothetical protein
MRSYWDIDRATSHCISFVEADEVDDELAELVDAVRKRGFKIAYVDCARFIDCPWEISSAIGNELQTDHPPYHEGQEANLARWLDDIISLAYKTSGLVIVLDNGHLIFHRHRKVLTDLIEAFLVQFHHWYEQKVPCHLCIQMEPSPVVAQLFTGRK